MTKEQEKRTIAALIDTQRALDRAMNYSPAVRDHALIAFYESHIQKLSGMLAGAQ